MRLGTLVDRCHEGLVPAHGAVCDLALLGRRGGCPQHAHRRRVRGATTGHGCPTMTGPSRKDPTPSTTSDRRSDRNQRRCLISIPANPDPVLHRPRSSNPARAVTPKCEDQATPNVKTSKQPQSSPNGIRTRVSTLREREGTSSRCAPIPLGLVRDLRASRVRTSVHRNALNGWAIGWTVGAALRTEFWRIRRPHPARDSRHFVNRKSQ